MYTCAAVGITQGGACAHLAQLVLQLFVITIDMVGGTAAYHHAWPYERSMIAIVNK